MIVNIQIIELCLYVTAYTSNLKQSELLYNSELKIQIIHKLQKDMLIVCILNFGAFHVL